MSVRLGPLQSEKIFNNELTCSVSRPAPATAPVHSAHLPQSPSQSPDCLHLSRSPYKLLNPSIPRLASLKLGPTTRVSNLSSTTTPAISLHLLILTQGLPCISSVSLSPCAPVIQYLQPLPDDFSSDSLRVLCLDYQVFRVSPVYLRAPAFQCLVNIRS